MLSQVFQHCVQHLSPKCQNVVDYEPNIEDDVLGIMSLDRKKVDISSVLLENVSFILKKMSRNRNLCFKGDNAMRSWISGEYVFNYEASYNVYGEATNNLYGCNL